MELPQPRPEQPGDLRVIALRGIPDASAGDDLAGMILMAAESTGNLLRNGDVLVIAQKIVSKCEGRIVDLASVVPSDFAARLARRMRKDARQIEVVLRESRRIVRMDRNVIISETHHGFICANAGVDESNVSGGGTVSLLPLDADRSAAGLRRALLDRAGVEVAVIVSDTFGRPWRDGLVNVAIGVAGIEALYDYRGQRDATGFTLKATVIAVADELASAAELVMGKAGRVPAAVVRGFPFQSASGTAKPLIRPRSKDMFR